MGTSPRQKARSRKQGHLTIWELRLEWRGDVKTAQARPLQRCRVTFYNFSPAAVACRGNDGRPTQFNAAIVCGPKPYVIKIKNLGPGSESAL
jgi:hypothetical protein